MTDKVLVRPGTGRGEVAVDKAYFHDNSDGSFSLGDAAHAYGWNTSTLAWSKLPVDTTTGALLVSATLAAGSVDIGKVDQGTPGASAWPVSLGSLPSLATGSNVIGHVIVDTAPSTAVTNAGTFAVQASTAVSIAAGQTIALSTPVSLAASQTVGLAAGSQVIGHVVTDSASVATVSLAASQTVGLAAGSQVIGHVVTDSASVATVSLAANQTVTANPTRPATGTTSSPASVTTSVATVLASNAGRYGATVYNESGATAYIKFGTAATVTDYTIQVAVGGYYEVPFAYTGVLTGITSSGTAVLRVTEITA